MIAIEGLTYSYPGSERPALTDLSLQVAEGELIGILGPNGSGKSTLCYAMAGFLPSYFHGEVAGSIQVGGLDPITLGPSALVGTVGFVFQDPFSQITGARFSVREEVAFGLENLAVPPEEMRPRVDDALRLTGLTHLADRSPFELSGGEQQRLALASVLALQPKILILDEPTSQLDPHGARQVIEAVDRLTAERKTTVLLVEQRLEWLAAHADRLVILSDGRVAAQGRPSELLTSPGLEELGVRPTRYTLAARGAHQRGWIGADRRLPVTLDRAVEFFG